MTTRGGFRDVVILNGTLEACRYKEPGALVAAGF